jgi:hypothetical protein
MTSANKALGITALETPTFSVHPTLEEDVLVARVAGNGDMAAIEPLARYVKILHKEALALGLSRVHLDVRDLYFLNSSCLKSLLTWINGLSADTPPAYGVCFITNANLFWQRRSLEALRRLAPNVVTIE